MDITSYLIERELLARRAVILPFIGTLSYQRVSSRFALDRSHLIPPQNTLCLAPSTEQQGDEFIELIAAEIGITHNEAIETYNHWYESSIDNIGAVLHIDSVCSIDLINYAITSIDEQFSEHLMPLGSEPFAIGRPLDSRGIEASTFQSHGEMPRSQILETLPIIEDIPYVPVVEQQPILGRQQIAVNHYAHPTANAPLTPRKQCITGTSTAALVVSIIIAAIAALYITYTLLSDYEIINL